MHVLLIIIFPVLGAVAYFLVNAGGGMGPSVDEGSRDQALQDRHYGA